jgi:5-methylcytosine-specific restriction endonuclease McrA
MNDDKVKALESTCNDLGWDPDVVLDVVTWVLQERRFIFLQPDKNEWAKLRVRKDLIEEMSNRIGAVTQRRWSQQEIKAFTERCEIQYISPAREPISYEAQLQLLFNKEQTCVFCGKNGFDMIPEIDHRMPASKGGLSNYPNLQWACRDCNRKKSNKVTKEWKNA